MLRYEANEVKHQDFDEKRFRFPSFAWQANNVDSFQKKNALGSLEKTSTSFWIWFDMVDFRMFFHDNFSDLRKFALKWKNLTEIWGIFDEFLGHIFFDEFWGWIYVKKLSRVIWFRFPVDFQNFDECIDCIASVFSWPEIWRWSNEVVAPVSCLEFTPWLG